MSILGVETKQLKTHGDKRGYFREIIRFNDPFFADCKNFAQWSHSLMQKNVVKAWHYHHIQIDWWYIMGGQVQIALYDNRQESPTYKNKILLLMGDSFEFGPETKEICLKIPPGVLHGCKVLSKEAHLFYITSQTYSPEEEGRIPYNAKEIDHDWGSDAIVADNDKKYFAPTSKRELIT